MAPKYIKMIEKLMESEFLTKEEDVRFLYNLLTTDIDPTEEQKLRLITLYDGAFGYGLET